MYWKSRARMFKPIKAGELDETEHEDKQIRKQI